MRPDVGERRPALWRGSGEARLWNGGEDARASHGFAFFGLCLFTVLLYVRPADLLPSSIGTLELLIWSPIGLTPIDPRGFAIVKTVAIVTVLAYVAGKLAKGERLTDWPVELRALAVIVGLGILFMPIAAAPKDSYDELTDTFLKVAIIFVLMINLFDSLSRLRTMFRITVLCGTGIAIGAAVTYWQGKFTAEVAGVGVRIEGIVEGIFGNPNDLATALNLLVPVAVALAVLARGWRRALYATCAAVLAVGVVVTFSRAGFLGLVAIAGFGLFKLLPRKPGTTMLAAAALAGLLLLASPGGYGDRLASIFDAEADKTGSASERLDLLKRAALVAAYHPVLGVGMGNYHIYSIRELRAHNSYLEIAAELGLAGLAAYLVLIAAPLVGLRRVERETRGAAEQTREERELNVFSVAVQAAMLGYIVCSFFASIQYLWYLYYLVAYAIALRQINAAAAEPVAAPAARTVGALWPEHARLAPARLWALAAREGSR